MCYINLHSILTFLNQIKTIPLTFTKHKIDFSDHFLLILNNIQYLSYAYYNCTVQCKKSQFFH
jgi:hypothetical protein